MFSIKVAYNGKNIVLPRGVDSLTKIEHQLNNRFPGEFPNGITFKYQENIIDSFDQLLSYAPTSEGRNLKINVEPTNLIKSSEINETGKTCKPERKEKVNEETKSNVQVDEKVSIGEIEERYLHQIINSVLPVSEVHVGEIGELLLESNMSLRERMVPNNLSKPEHFNQIVSSHHSNTENSVLEFEDMREIEPGVYECVFCREFELCNICDTKRKIGEDSKLIKMINKIVEKKVNEKVEERLQKIEKQIEELKRDNKEQHVQNGSHLLKTESSISQKEQKVEVFESFLKEEKEELLNNIYEVSDDAVKNRKEIVLGEEFSWTFNIKIKNPLLKPLQKISILDSKNFKILKNFSLNIPETKVEIGPFKAEKEGQMERTFRLCLSEEDEICVFGPKFGFNLDVMKGKEKKRLSNNLRMEVERIKKSCNVERSTEYLIEKLKEIGINADNFEQSKELIFDILQTI